MILQSLYKYYKAHPDLPKVGTEEKQLGFLIVIDKDGNFLRLEDKRLNKKEAQSYIVTKTQVKSSGISPNYLYENAAYVLGVGNARDLECNNEFIRQTREIASYSDNEALLAMCKFYEQSREDYQEQVSKSDLWEDLLKSQSKRFSNISFLREGDMLPVAAIPELFNLLPSHDDKKAICLITGEGATPVRLSAATPILGSKTNAKLVSYNHRAYESYGHSQGRNATISEEAEHAYSTALNHLLRPESRNKVIVGDRTYVFFTLSENDTMSEEMDEIVADMLSGKTVIEDKEYSESNILDQMADLKKRIWAGKDVDTTNDAKMVIIGIAPNGAREAITNYQEIPLFEFLGRIQKHYDDMEIEGSPIETAPYRGIHNILRSVSVAGKEDSLPPSLADQLMYSIFYCRPYPITLLEHCLRRIVVTGDMSRTRAGILKAYITRKTNKHITNMIDYDNTNPAYHCGRFLATCEKIQSEANGSTSIKDTMLGRAVSSPASIFARLALLSTKHERQLHPGRSVNMVKIKEEIMSKIGTPPKRLSAEDQAIFFLGYYAQKKDFYRKKSESEENYEKEAE